MTTTLATQPDERRNLPSASRIERLMLCPGSWTLEQSLPRPPGDDAPSPDADRGRRIHAALADEPNITLSALSDDERDVADRCRLLADDLARQTGMADADFIIVERRFWLTNDELERVFSGKPDRVTIKGREALIVDFKTGNVGAEDATANAQLRALAVLLADAFDLDSCRVVIVQPLVTPQVSTAFYNADDLKQARAELLAVLAAAMDEAAPRLAGESQCRFCTAKAVCTEAQERVLAVARTRGQRPPMMPDKLAVMLDACVEAERVIDAVRDYARSVLALDCGVIPGWTLKPGRVTDTITNPQAVFDAAQRRGVTQEQFLKCVNIGKAALKAELKTATGAKGKALDAEFDALLDGNTETKTGNPVLTRVRQ